MNIYNWIKSYLVVPALRRRTLTVRFQHCVVFIALALAWVGPFSSSAAETVSDQSDPSAQSDDERISALIDQLSHASFEARTSATRELINAGPRALSALRKATQGDDFEAALLARDLVRVFDQLLFAGVTIELSSSESRMAWNEPLDIRLRLQNGSKHDAHVPVERRDSGPADSANRHGTQVASLLDVADFLVVTGPDGDAIEFYIDDINEDGYVFEAVHRRAESPVQTTLPAGESMDSLLIDFNRGWARYRMLHAGEYRVQLVYQPDWNEQEMIDAGVGRVTSNVLTLTVTDSAPQVVRDATVAARLLLERSGDEWVAQIQNTSDLPLPVNLNLHQTEGPPFARLQWNLVYPGDELVPFEADHPAEFRSDRIVTLEPGEIVELDRDRVPDLRGQAGTGQSSECTAVFATYGNLTSVVWQRMQRNRYLGNPQAPEALRRPLPPRLLTFSMSSDRVEFNNGR